MDAVKFKDGSKDIIEGLLAPYGGPSFLAGKDFDGEFFDANTNFELEWFGDWERPVLFGHGTDPALKTAVVGRMKVTVTDAGLWGEAKLNEANAYKEAIADLVAKDALGWSAGSVERFYQPSVSTKTGHIGHFPIIEGSLVTRPANPLAAAHYAAKSVDVIEHLAVLGVVAPEALSEPSTDVLTPEDVPPEVVHVGGVVVETSEPLTLTDAPTDIIEAVKSALTPQSLHDASVASGAVCSEGKTPPATVLAIAGKAAEKQIDPEVLAREMNAHAVEVARSLLA
jgi:hypothetical protein